MKTLHKLLICAILVFPLSSFAQQIERTCHTLFKADVTYTCGSFLNVNFEDQCQLPDGEHITRWTWYFGDGAMSNDWKPRHYYDRPGVYSVKLIINTNLGRTDSAERKDYITVGGNVFVQLGNDTAIEKGSSLTLDAGNPGSQYWWSTGANTQKITITEAGQYWVHVKKGDCESRDIINISYKQKGVYSEFVADTTYTCGSFLKVNFKETSVLEKGDFISRWTWDFGDGATSNDWRPAHEYSKPGVYTVKLIVQTDQGYSDTVIREKYITIEGDVYVNLGDDFAICENTSIVLDAGNPNAQYWWSTGANTQKITVTEPGQYWVHIKKGKCESRDIINISEKPPVFPQFGYQLTGTCLPMNVKFSDSSTWCGNNSIIRRRWDFGDGGSSTDENPDHIYTEPDTFIVRLTVWDENGFSITRSKRVVVAQAPGVGPLVDLGPDRTVCETEMLVLDAGNPGASFAWSNGDFFQTTVITNTGLVWVRVQTEDGCVASDTVMITVKPSMQPKFGYFVQSNCLPAKVQFVDSTITCGVDIIGWHWDFGDGSVSEAQHPSHSYLQAGEFIVQLTMYDNFGGTITKSKKIVIQPGTIYVNLGKDTSICMGEVLLLNAGVSAANYSWNTGETSQEIAVMDDGAYSVTVEKNGCIGKDTIMVKTIFPVTPGFDYTITDKCLPVKVKFEDKTVTTCNQQVVQWRWDFGDGTTSNEKNPTHTYITSDSFAVRLTITTNQGLSISKSKKIFIESSPECRLNLNPGSQSKVQTSAGWLNEVKVKVSPNPSHGLVYVYLSKVPERALKVTVVDRYGQPLLVTSMSNMSTFLNLSRMAKGYYTIEVSNGLERKSIPILIQ